MNNCQKQACSIVSKLLDIAYELNNIESLSSGGCCAVFRAARMVLDDAHLDGTEIVSIAVENGERKPEDIERYCQEVKER